MQAPIRDLASSEVWEGSLERSRRRRVLAAQGRREHARKKQASAAISAAMVVGQTAPAVAMAAAGGGTTGPKVSQSSPANRAIAPGAPSEMLRLGSTGPDVVRIQSALAVTPDGIFGPETAAAVRTFQMRNSLLVDGIVGPQTWKVLFNNVTGASYSPSSPRFGFTIQRASQVETAQVRPAIGGKGPVAKIMVRTVPHTDKAVAAKPESVKTQRHGGTGTQNADIRTPETRVPHGETQNNTTPVSDPSPAPAPSQAPSRGGYSCNSGRLIAPVKHYTVTGVFGESRPGHTHAGEDLAAPSGTPIVAAACGVVVEVGQESGYGNMVCIKHSSTLTTCYAHMSGFATREGDHVHQGEVIGYVGCTGSCTGPHVHFETRLNGTPVNPAPYLSGARRAKSTEGPHGGSGTSSAKASAAGGTRVSTSSASDAPDATVASGGGGSASSSGTATAATAKPSSTASAAAPAGAGEAAAA